MKLDLKPFFSPKLQKTATAIRTAITNLKSDKQLLECLECQYNSLDGHIALLTRRAVEDTIGLILYADNTFDRILEIMPEDNVITSKRQADALVKVCTAYVMAHFTKLRATMP